MIHVLQCEDAFDDGKKAEIKQVLKTPTFLYVILKRKNVGFLLYFSDADFFTLENFAVIKKSSIFDFSFSFFSPFTLNSFIIKSSVFGTNYFGRIGWEIFANNCCVYIAFRQKEMLPGFPSMRH